ncbi:hypothetical protein JXO59_11175 [candidate division KSB1 bacterium]|nr:hypothetical protein [candidate division KSB1 bacterium]
MKKLILILIMAISTQSAQQISSHIDSLSSLESKIEPLIFDLTVDQNIFNKNNPKGIFPNQSKLDSLSQLLTDIKKEIYDLTHPKPKHQIEFESKRDILIKIYGYSTTLKLLAHETWIGMSNEMAEVSLGKPLRIHKTIYKNHIREQWVYPKSLYLYFTNDTLTSIQCTE